MCSSRSTTMGKSIMGGVTSEGPGSIASFVQEPEGAIVAPIRRRSLSFWPEIVRQTGGIAM
jgi:hypothetical protein